MNAIRSPGAELARWSLLAQAGRRLTAAVEYADTEEAVAAVALPLPGDWSIVDVVEKDGSIRRLPVVHSEPEKQRLARMLGASWVPTRDSWRGTPTLMRCRAEQVVDPLTDEWLTGTVGDEADRAIVRRLGITAVLTVPLRANDQLLGAITFLGGMARQGYSDDDLSLAEDLASRCATAIAHARRVEELKESVLLRDRVLRYVAHDLKNPLGAIVFAASHILDEARAPRSDLPAAHRIKVAETIVSAAAHMQRLIGDLLEVALIGAGGLTIHPTRVDPAGLLEGIRRTHEVGLVAGCLRVDTAVSDGLPVLWVDPGRLRQVFGNLIENAARFTPAGGVVTLGAERLRDSVLFSVADTGRGIPPEEMPHLFDVWGARRDRTGNVGLGLTICRGIVEAHGGVMWAESAIGTGSTFFFQIPVANQSGPGPVGTAG